MSASHESLLPALAATLDALAPAVDDLPAERRRLLEALGRWVAERRRAGEVARLVFVCTHNSRRSHMGQLWAAAAAAYRGLDDVVTHSAGTEATAFAPGAVAALARAGFAIGAPGVGTPGVGASRPEPGGAPSPENPRYPVRLTDQGAPHECFSKRLEDPSLPTSGYAAVMTCAEADRACPHLPGADARFSLPYLDPKAADGTPEEAATYDARSRQIATEMLQVMGRAAGREAGAP